MDWILLLIFWMCSAGKKDKLDDERNRLLRAALTPAARARLEAEEAQERHERAPALRPSGASTAMGGSLFLLLVWLLSGGL